MIKTKPTQSQLLLPLLETLRDAGGAMKTADAIEAVATRLGVPPEVRKARVIAGKAGSINAFDRDARWTRQRARLMGYIDDGSKGIWKLSETGAKSLTAAKHGQVLTVFITDRGMCLWADCQDAMAIIEDESTNLVLTSPPYPLIRQKQYKNMDVDRHLDFLTDCARHWRRILSPDGSIMLNMADVWDQGRPTLDNLYQERLILRLVEQLGFHVAQKLYWWNRAKMPGPAEWVTVRRVRVTPAVENIYWLSKSPMPVADNRRVLRPYSDSMLKLLAAGGESEQIRPSGHQLKTGAFGAQNGGSIAHNLIDLPHTSSNDHYLNYCRANNLPAHPARFPIGLPEFLIKLATEPGDCVYDPFGGSLTTALAAEQLDRRWIASELNLEYLAGGVSRFTDQTGFERYRALDRAA